MSEQVSSGVVCSGVNKSEVVVSHSNEDADSSLFGIHIQSTCSIDLKEFDKIDSCCNSDDQLAASELRDATEIAQSPKSELVERGSDEKGDESARASSEADELDEFSAKVQPDAGTEEFTVSSIELSKSNENCTMDDNTAVSDTVLENFPDFSKETLTEKASPIHDSGHEDSCVGSDSSQVKDRSVDAGDSLTTGNDLPSDDKQTDDSEMDIDNDSQSGDEKPVIESDLGESKNHFCADASNLVAPDTQSDRGFQGMRDKIDIPLVSRKRRLSRRECRQFDSSTGKKIPELLSCIPRKVSVRQPPSLMNRFSSRGNGPPCSGFAEYDDQFSTSGPGFHDNGMRMPFPDMNTPGIFPPDATHSPWYGSPVKLPFSCDTSVPPPGMMFNSDMAAPPGGGCLPWDGSLQSFGGVPPPVTPGFVPPGPYMAPPNVYQPPPITPSYGVPPAPVGTAPYTPCNGMAPEFPGASQFGVSTAMPYPDQSYQEWYEWCQKYSEWAQNYSSNTGTETANGSEAVVSKATSKSSDSKSPATISKPTTVVKVPVDKKPRRPHSPIGLIPLPSTGERQVVKVTMSSTKPLLASVETQSSNQREVTTKPQSSSRGPSPPTPACSVSRKDADISEKNLDLSVTDKTDISTNSKTAKTMWLSSFKQDSTSEPEQIPALPQKQPSPAGESSSWKQRLSLESKPSKPSSLSGRRNLVSLAATFNAETSNAVESKVPVSTSDRMFTIGNLPAGIKATEIRTFISRYGTVVNCKVGGLKSQKDAGLFALVTMETEKDVQVCVAKLNETNFNGNRIVVAKFEPH